MEGAKAEFMVCACTVSTFSIVSFHLSLVPLMDERRLFTLDMTPAASARDASIFWLSVGKAATSFLRGSFCPGLSSPRAMARSSSTV